MRRRRSNAGATPEGPRRGRGRFGAASLLAVRLGASPLCLASAVLLGATLPTSADAAKPSGLDAKAARGRAAEIRKDLAELLQKAQASTGPTEAELAKRLVRGQLMLSENDPEHAAIVFLDLLENHPATDAARQALVYLGEALIELDMMRWASECFGRNLADTDPEAARFHQRSLAHLLSIAAPAQKAGFARRPGLSATPEVRARLEAIGMSVESQPPEGLLSDADVQRVVQWVERLPADQRIPLLEYAYGRWLFLRGQPQKAMQHLEVVSPLGSDLGEGGPAGPYRVRAMYIAGAAALSEGDVEAALQRFGHIASAHPRDDEDDAIVELAWLAIGRIQHDEGNIDASVDAYREISRDSVYFPEAMYETAWTLLRAGRNEGAIAALDLLLVYDPDSPIVPEIKQLRGKIRIQERDWAEAEREFLALRREFSDLGRQVGEQLLGRDDATAWFSSVIAEDMPHFSIEAIMPLQAARLAEALPRAVQGRDIAREVGTLSRELEDVRALLAQMETAVRAKERANLFPDLAAAMAGLDAAELELIEIHESMWRWLRTSRNSNGLERLDDKRRMAQKQVERAVSGEGSQGAMTEKIRQLAEINHRYELAIAALRAQLVASERYYEQTRKRQQIDHAAFLKQATELRDEIAALEKEARTQHDELDRLRTGLRLDAPALQAQRSLLVQYGAFLDDIWSQAKPSAAELGVWNEVRTLRLQIDAARRVVDRAALARLSRALVILTEERRNLDQYLVEMKALEGSTRTVVGEVMQATTRDVVGELQNLIIRSEVGLLDVAWAIQEVEAEQIRRLEVERDRDLRQVDALVQEAMEELK